MTVGILPNVSASPLLLLPSELRNLIYAFCYMHDSTVMPPPHSRSPLALAYTCRQLYAETRWQAFEATTFRTIFWEFLQLASLLKKVPLGRRACIKRLEITVPVTGFLNQYSSLQGIRFGDAGMTHLEELYLNFTGRCENETTENHVMSNLMVIILKTVQQPTSECLQKIRIAHQGAFRWTTVHKLYKLLHKTLQSYHGGMHATIRTQYTADGDFHLWHTVNGQSREVSILFGYTVREAECPSEVRRQLLTGKILDNVRARQPQGKALMDLDSEDLANRIEHLCRDFGVLDLVDTSTYY